MAAPPLAVLDAVGLLGEGALDTAPAQVGAVAARPVGLIAQGPVRARPWPSRPQPGYGDLA